ncbi:MAG: hypothetical protein ACF8PN_08960 [Phycisphaerales bacterium]
MMRKKTASGRLFALVTLLCMLLATPDLLVAQDSNQPQPGPDPQAEIERLQARIRELEAQLADAYRTISDLRRQLGQGGGTVTPNPGVDPTDPDPVALPENQPLASPSALLETVVTQYDTDFANASWSSEVDRRVHFRNLRAWSAQLNRKHRGRFEWIAEMQGFEALSEGGATATVVVRDPQTGARWSEPVMIEVPRRFVDRLEEIEVGEYVELKGVIRLDLKLNADRETPGAFDVPPLVAPFVEFVYELDLQSVAEVDAPWEQNAMDENP